jgi:hypothetical protein
VLEISGILILVSVSLFVNPGWNRNKRQETFVDLREVITKHGRSHYGPCLDTGTGKVYPRTIPLCMFLPDGKQFQDNSIGSLSAVPIMSLPPNGNIGMALLGLSIGGFLWPLYIPLGGSNGTQCVHDRQSMSYYLSGWLLNVKT